MSKKRKLIKFRYLLLTLFFVITLIISGQGFLSVFADSSSVPSVIKDLTADKNFNFSEYPEKADDYSIQVIQIAESKNGKLYLYTYQPCQNTFNISATEINMSLSDTPDGTELYSLKQVDTWGVFAKYLVERVNVSLNNERYYNISSIYRDWDKDIDGEAATGNIKNKKAYTVGQCWEVKTQGDTVTYKMLKIDTVEILDPFTSFIRRNKNNSANNYYQDNYYIAFSTDRNIDTLLSATVDYRLRDYFYKSNNVLGFESTEFLKKATFSNEKRTQKNVYCDEVNELFQQGYKLFGIFDLNDKYSWERIQSSADFVKNSGVSSSDKNVVSELQWVLMFDECSVYRYASEGTLLQTVEETGQIIDEVTILRLEFVEDGITYNLGAVSDVVSKDHDFSNKNDGMGGNDKKQGFWAYIWNCIVKLFTGKANVWETIVAVVSLVVVVVVAILVIKFIKFVVEGIFK